MKQKFFSILIIFTCLFGFIASANAENYVGTLSNVTMNGKHFNDVANTVFSLTDNGDGTYLLQGEIQKIGKMPGTISINVPVYIINGTISPTAKNREAGILKTAFMKQKIKLRNISGSLQGGFLHFVIETYAGWDIFPMFPASVTFNGTK